MGLLRVLVVSSVRLVEEAVAIALERRGCLSSAAASDGRSGATDTRELRPDVVLVDASQPEGIGHARQLAASFPAAKVVAFGVTEKRDEIVALAAAGTAGYVCASATAQETV